MKKFLLLVVLAFAAPLLVVGCGSSGGDDKASPTTEKSDGAKGESADSTTTTEDQTEDTEPDDGDAPVSGDAKAYVDAMAANLANSGEGDDLQLTEDQANCLAPRWVRTVGVDRFKEAGVSPQDIEDDSSTIDFAEIKLSESDANKMYDAFGACDVNLRDMMMESMAGDDVPAAARECMEKVLTEDAIRKLMILGLTGQDDALDDPNNMPPELAGIMGCAFMGMGEDTGTTTGN